MFVFKVIRLVSQKRGAKKRWILVLSMSNFGTINFNPKQDGKDH